MPDEDSLPLASLLSSTAGAVLLAQQSLDGMDIPHQQASGYAIPFIDATLRFGVITTSTRKILFIPRGKTSSRMHHRLSFRLSAVPNPPLPLNTKPISDTDALPLELLEPGFIVEED